MRDRQPKKPGRVKITPESGEAFYAVMEMADEPTDLGTPPTKENLLSDDAEISLFGTAADRTVSESFLGIGAKLKLIMSNVATITLTVKDQAGNAVKNALVNGVYSESGDAVYTNDSGVASGYVAEGNQTVSIKDYADIENSFKTFSVVKGTTITETLTVNRRNFLKVTSSKQIKFSGNASTIDESVVGGGGGGYSTQGSGGGGGGGYCVVSTGISVEANTLYPVVIGAGGKNGSDGGESSAFGVKASGGKHGNATTGGIGNGDGGGRKLYYNGVYQSGDSNATAGTVDGYSSYTETVKYGGGGSGVNVFDSKDSVEITDGSAAGFGGNGQHANGQDGYGGGGGPRANGGSGCVTMRIHFDFGDLAA